MRAILYRQHKSYAHGEWRVDDIGDHVTDEQIKELIDWYLDTNTFEIQLVNLEAYQNKVYTMDNPLSDTEFSDAMKFYKGLTHDHY